MIRYGKQYTNSGIPGVARETRPPAVKKNSYGKPLHPPAKGVYAVPDEWRRWDRGLNKCNGGNSIGLA